MSARLALVLALLAMSGNGAADTPAGPPLAAIDLGTEAGAEQVAAQWRYSDVTIVEAEFDVAGADGQPSGAKGATFDYQPHAGGADFDDSRWTPISPATLSARRGHGKLSFNWYRIRITIPSRVGEFDTRGSTVVFTAAVDDYAEIWVDGELPRAAGQSGASVVAGWNARNRLVIGRNVEPGRVIQLAVFGINGPISAAPTNFIWMREARLEFYGPSTLPFAVTPQEVNVDVEQAAPALAAIVPANPKLFKLAEGFIFTEGPVWSADGYLLFSDPNANRIYKYREPGRLEVFREQSGYAGADIGEYSQPGSNGLAFDRARRLTINEHGNRRVSRLEADGSLTTLAERYQGKRLNSPNDLVYSADGTLYFTDPPFGLPRFERDPRRELDVFGIYRVKDGVTELLASDLKGPNGIALSPDERFLYIGNWDPGRKVVLRYPRLADGRLGAGAVFFDMTGRPGADAIDGIKVDSAGNLYVSGPGGIWIIDRQGQHLGTLRTPKHAHNMAWGGSAGRTLYLTAQDRLYRIDLLIPGYPATLAGAQP